MKALTLNADRRLSLAAHPKPEPRDALDVTVEVVQSGICGTDRSVLVGKFPAETGVVMGHEAVGVVDSVGAEVTRLAPGDRVVINPTLYCGTCPTCLEGHWDFCSNKAGTEVGLDYDGSFADFIRLPELFCHRVPDEMSFDRAVVIEPLTCALNNVEAGRLQPGETAVIVGAGPMGVVTAMAAERYGARVLLLEPDTTRRSLAQEVFSSPEFGERVTLHHPEEPELTGRGNLVIDSVGNQLERCLDYTATRGRIVIMGFNSNASATVQPLKLLQDGVQIIGAGDYNSMLFPKAVELARSMPLERVITHRFTLEEHEEAFKVLAATPGVDYSALKVLLVPHSEGAET
ncbi:threonine dehydrogenase-like Zn-dependent dehydrogenase [Actinopolyspora biskrensis]|uniref:Threonine dehydrogenase-like Zn-dependent dehydrogenase n=1 Tax=Actinopolyspora biskrensis TaxID=1470178 RepID=A0A852YT27_9ACTN|nr:alcohol dehydrogenase catalytic domain-containing protein [Actinopolyspora biskrensis]NYH77260.1 threonine dehydrogenase-like Zn-dependent dehydrogenase [Actinopolyspora biskrensis]